VIFTLFTAFIGILLYAVAEVIEEEDAEFEALILEHARELLVNQRKRKRGGVGIRRKRRYIVWDRTRALESISADYLGPLPRFNADEFKRMFRVSRANYERIRNALCRSDPFFRDSYDAHRRRSICVDAKILIALKYICYGTAINSFRDYFQMGESTSRLGLVFSMGSFVASMSLTLSISVSVMLITSFFFDPGSEHSTINLGVSFRYSQLGR
jgi:hypothetical protein